jgi:hypothetical protein
MKDTLDSIERKLRQAFEPEFGSGVERICAGSYAKDVQTLIAGALREDFPDDAEDIAFHLSDWANSAAFMVLVHLKPEAFTKEELRIGVEQFLIHAPNHIAAAAKLSGNAVQDVFNVNALDGVHQFD